MKTSKESIMDVKDEITKIICKDCGAEKAPDAAIFVDNCKEDCLFIKKETFNKILSLPIGVEVTCPEFYIDCYCKRESRECAHYKERNFRWICTTRGKIKPTIQTAIDEYIKNHSEGK